MPTNAGNYVDPQRARLHQATVTLTDAQIKALPTLGDPFGEVIVPAPGDGVAIMPIIAQLRMTLQPGGGYTGFDLEPPIYGFSFSGDRFAMVDVPQDVFELGSIRIVTLSPKVYDVAGFIQGDADSGTNVNVPLVFSIFNNDSIALGGGNAGNALRISVLYALVNIDTGSFL